MSKNPNVAFTLRVEMYSKKTYRPVVITVYDGHIPNPHGWSSGWDSAGRVKLTVQVKHGGDVIFPAGQLTCALHGASDGVAARELVMALVAMKPGDTDRDYFADYTPAQLAWVKQHGEALDAERQRRYCDENGDVRIDPEHGCPRGTRDESHVEAVPARFTTWGSVRGRGPVRATEGEAQADLARDQQECSRQGGYSDRRVYKVDGDGYVVDSDSGANVWPHGRTHRALRVEE